MEFKDKVVVVTGGAKEGLYLASDKAGFITGENICIDGGMTRNMIYHNDFGWKLGD